MALLGMLAPLPFQEHDPERLAATVRRVSAAYGVATLIFAVAFASGLLGNPRGESAGLALVAAAGFLPIAAAARRWPVASASAFVLWIWAASVASLFTSQGRFEVAIGIFLTSIVAAGLMLGGGWAVATAAATAVASAAVVGWFARTGAHAASDPPTPLALWAVTMMSVAALPVLLGEALGRLRRALREAEEAERRYRLVADNARDLIWLVEEERVVYASPACEALLGWTPEEMIARGSNLASLTPDSAQAIRATLEQAFANGSDHVRYEAEHLRKDGGAVWCEVEASLRRGPDGRVRGMSGVTRDVSERRRSEAERAKIQAELVQAQKMEIVGRLAAGVAHDLNNQLTVIIAGAEALGDEDASVRADVQKDVLDSALNAAALTRQLQQYSRLRAPSFAPCDLSQLVERAQRTLQRVLGADVQLVVRALPRPAIVRVDAAQLEQVILNLAVNARDAMPSGGVLTIEVAASRPDEPHAWILRVSDTGTGIDAPTLERIFEPFFTTKPEGRGTGLGLSMVRRVADEAGGRVRVETQLGRGTTFEVELPRYEGSLAAAEGELVQGAGHAAAATVLVVDDSPEVRRLLHDLLARSGHHVIQAASPASALEAAASVSTLDLVVTDVVMPGRNGPELVAALRRLHPALPALFVSGHASEAFDIADDSRATFLAKPFSTRALKRAVREALAQRSEGGGEDGG